MHGGVGLLLNHLQLAVDADKKTLHVPGLKIAVDPDQKKYSPWPMPAINRQYTKFMNGVWGNVLRLLPQG